MKYGYDKVTGSLVSWDFDFHYEGKHSLPPEGAKISENQVEDEMIGCAFMSGWSDNVIVIRSDGDSFQYGIFGVDAKHGLWIGTGPDQEMLKKMSSRMPICVCGKIVSDSVKMMTLCGRFPTSRIYVCPLIDELAAFGVLIREIGHKPYRFIPAWDNKEQLNAEHITFDAHLEGDGYGRMADVVFRGLPVLNEMMTTIGVSPFYGKVLHAGWVPGSLALVRLQDMDTFFPHTFISAKNYAATSVPVRMETTEKFRKSVMDGYNEAFIDVFVVTDYVPGISTFLRFYKTFSGKGFVFATERDQKRTMPIFRADKAYRF